MTTRSELAAGIEPGSLPHGGRQELTAGLEGAVGGGLGAPAPGGEGAVQPPVDSGDDPLAAMLSGDLTPPATDMPITSGLSVGAGPGPGGQIQQVSPEHSRLLQIAQQAKHPLIRQMARNELRRIVGEQV